MTLYTHTRALTRIHVHTYSDFMNYKIEEGVAPSLVQIH